MSHGYNLQAIIRRGLNNSVVQFDRLAQIATNLTNYNTNGYKSVSFDQILTEDGFVEGITRRYDSQGTIIQTTRDFDVAIDGKGYIPVTSPTGDVAYTREASFKLDKEGKLITNDGWLVGDGIKLPVNYERFRIEGDGTCYVEYYGDKPKEVIGKIPLVTFPNSEGLIQGEYNKYYITEESGEPMLQKEHNKIKQGCIERSNVDIYESVYDIMRMNASMLSSFRLLKVVDDMYTKSINLRQ